MIGISVQHPVIQKKLVGGIMMMLFNIVMKNIFPPVYIESMLIQTSMMIIYF